MSKERIRSVVRPSRGSSEVSYNRTLMSKVVIATILTLPLQACGPRTGPDETLAGGVLGAAWGAGAGAVVGHQISYAGEGAAVGAGLGMVSGAAQGLGFDVAEESAIRQEQELEALRVQNSANAQEIENLHARLDFPSGPAASPSINHVYFDPDGTNLRAGSIADLEVIAEGIKRNPHARSIVIKGHSDDAGTPQYNERIAEARARSVLAYLASRGIAMDQMKVESHGSARPVTSNNTPEGRQLNRRVDIVVMP